MSVAKFLDSERLTLSQAHRIAERAVRRFALQDKVVRDVPIPDEEVRSVYEGQKERFVEVHLERITVRDAQTARLVITDVGSGKTFEEIARARSTDPLRAEGGDMGYVQLTSLDTQVQGAVEGAVEGGLTDPIQSGRGYVVYRVLDRRTKPFNEVEKDIRGLLRQNQRDSFYEGWLAARVRDAKIVVNPKYGRFDKSQGQPTVVPSSRELAP
jgi:peptidyl-prolyl cis-trans isomerase C